MSQPMDPDVYEWRERAALHRSDRRGLETILRELVGNEGDGVEELRSLVRGYLHDLAQNDEQRGQIWLSRMTLVQLEGHLKKYQNHKPRLVEMITELEDISVLGVPEIRTRAIKILENWDVPIERRGNSSGEPQSFGSSFLTRPLFNNSLEDLNELVTRNFENLAELDLVRCELVHRQSDGARRLRSGVEQRIATIKTTARRGYRDNHSDVDEVNQTVPSEISDEVREWTNEAVAKLRAKLIDLGRRSPLISFKHASRSASQLRVVDERPDLLWQALDKGPMGFDPLPGEDQTPPDEQTPQFHIAYERARLIDEEFQVATENLGDNEADARAWQEAERALRARVREELGLPKLTYGKGLDVTAIARAHGFDPSFELKFSDDDGLESHHEDDSIRVLLTQKELDKRLKTIWDRAGTHLRETGLHTLHLVFGFVQWFEDDTSEIPMQAPLLMLPVALQREVKRGRYEYALRVMGDELEVNIALIEKARTHWGLQLPELRENDSPESYFVRTKLVLEKGSRLKLNSFVTLAVLPPMVLWKDLDPAAWPEDAFAKHRLLPGILGAKEFHQSSGSDEPIDIDDPINADRVPALITDADASQHRAIMDMAAGHDMAIEGPPGTGKSQTITNMIATALAKGKRVLFVAEKQAALRVVADRLRSAGFGPLLLELHGDRAVRSDVYDGIRDRLDCQVRHDSRALDDKRSELKRHRDLLRRYLALVRVPLGELGVTAHDLAWREIRLRSRFKREQIVAMEARWSPADPKALDRATLIERRELLEQFGQALTNLDNGKGERTRWALADKFDAFDQSTALDAAGAAADAAKAVADEAEALRKLGLAVPLANGDYSAFSQMLSSLNPFTCPDDKVVASALHSPDAASELLNAQARWRELGVELSVRVERPEDVTLATTQELGSALTIENCPETAGAAVGQRKKLAKLCDALASAQRDMDRLVERMTAGPNAATDWGCKVAQSVAELGGLDASAASMLRQDLVDPAALAVCAAAEREAAELLIERVAVLELVNAEALKAEPTELDAISDTLEATGFFGRLGGHYRATMRQAARLLRSEPVRLDAAVALRRAALLGRAIREFEQTHKAKQLFPPLLWDGIDSDFAALRTACDAISKAVNTLAIVDETEVLSWWLSSEQMERQRFSSCCSRLAPLLVEASDEGFGKAELSGALAACQARLEQFCALEAAIAAANLRPDCPLHWADQSIAFHLTVYHELRAQFDRLREAGTLSWAGQITEDLAPLQVSLSEVSALADSKYLTSLITSLQECKEPVGLMQQWTVRGPRLASALASWKVASDRLKEVAEVDAVDLAGNSEWGVLSSNLRELQNDRHGAGLAADLLKYRAALAGCGLQAFAASAVEKLVEANKLDDLYELLSSSALLRAYLGGDGSELSRVGSLALDAARKAFRRADKDLHKLEAAAIVSARLGDSIPKGKSHGRKSDYTELGLIEKEVELVRPRTPLRDVVHRAGSALQAMKPVWMMSPTSAAQFIRPGELNFDLLIVDEASQMRPEYSLSCMLRADQFVVVGDANQLPPSDHFQMATATVDDDDDGVGVDENTESILDLANQRFRKKPRLKWHYRSQHESLIQFSNRQFYDRELVVFPSPSANDDDLMGVKCTYVPSKHPEAAYESSINQREAEEVIEQAFGLMQRYPERSIGIVAMNAKQTELIQNEFDRLIVEEEKVRKYVEAFEGSVDEFFIKNLENVQGDERDIILISTVYGPGKDRKVRQNFGLMNREVGWRRLNVLVTRAKMSCRLITSLRPDDIKITDSSSRGVIAFKAYLTYAHNGAQYDDASGGETDSDFEIFVADAIRDAGYEVVYQVGVENFRIDLGVRHPSCPIGFIAGIECDGATYHSGLSVRDRDHIRQSVLEGLGWQIYRVWSTDWFADAGRETAKLIVWLDNVRDRIANTLSSQPSPKHNPPAKSGKDQQVNEQQQGDPAVLSAASLNELETLVAVDSNQPREPVGRKLRPLGDIEPYESVRGSLYELWRNGVLLGEAEVIKRATGTARLYSDGLKTSLPEYEGRVEGTGDTFRSFDLYAAMREVAVRAPGKDGG